MDYIVEKNYHGIYLRNIVNYDIFYKKNLDEFIDKGWLENPTFLTNSYKKRKITAA